MNYRGRISEDKTRKTSLKSVKKYSGQLKPVKGFARLVEKTSILLAKRHTAKLTFRETFAGQMITTTLYYCSVKIAKIYYFLISKIRIDTKVNAKLDRAPGEEMSSKIVVPKETTTAEITQSEAVTVDFSETTGTHLRADISAHNAKTIPVNKVTRIKSKAALMSYIRAPIVYLKHIITKRRATIEHVPAELLEVKSTTDKAKTTSEIEQSPATVSAVSIKTKHPTATANAEQAGAIISGITIQTNAVHSAPLAFWIYPELDENGRLLIRQVYNATQTGTKIEVI